MDGFRSHIVNPSHPEADAIFPEPELPQFIGGTSEIKGYIRGSYLLCTSTNPLSDVDIVLSYREIGTYYWRDLQRQIENSVQTETSTIFSEPKSSQLVVGPAEIREDIRSLRAFSSQRTFLSEADVVIAHSEIGAYYWPDFQRQVENPSSAGVNDRIWIPKSSQLVVGPVGIREDIRSLRAFSSQRTSLSEADVVLLHADPGTAITDFTQLRKSQIEKQRLEISKQVDILSQREDNWDGRGSQKPTDLTLAHANEVMGTLLDSVISAGYHWDTPSISSDGDGNVTAAWYKNEQQLHLQIGEHEAEYFRVWGTNIDTEMDVDFLKPEHYLPLWKWLIDE
ncbi:hypothetical protein F4X10_00685 [Candidatus Poribacteria bacterium]|nr:hypothetical protein [Candidatus Poribacteria bacterium]